MHSFIRSLFIIYYLLIHLFFYWWSTCTENLRVGHPLAVSRLEMYGLPPQGSAASVQMVTLLERKGYLASILTLR